MKTKFFKRNNVLSVSSSRSGRKQSSERTLFNIQVHHLLKWLVETYGISTSVYEASHRYMCFLSHMYLYKGLETTLKRIKYDRLKVLQYLSDSGCRNPVLDNTGLTHDGLPKKLEGLIPYIRSKQVKEIRFVMTLLYSLRRFNLPLQPDLETVTSPSSAGYYEWLFKYIQPFLKALSKRLPRKHKVGHNLKFPSWEGYHLTTKSSPTGGQSLVSCLQDLVNIPESLRNSIETFSGPELSNKMALLYHHLPECSVIFEQPLGKSSIFRRLSAIPDSEGKTRLIAIGDYWSQTSLKPLHDYLNIVLRSIPQDQTFNQGEGLKELPFSSDRTYYSFDLSAFTDRFPIKILIVLLTCAFGQEKALAWYDIIAGYDFDYKDPKGLQYDIRYNVGNPMGFYTSWPLTTLCHHFVVYAACRECQISWTKAKYKILGDDIIIYDTDLAEKYQELISLLGVEIQLQKSHIGNSLFEFAKRNFTPFGEISPFSIKGALSVSDSYIGFIELLKDSQDKGWYLDTPQLEAVLKFYHSRPRRYRVRNRKREDEKIELSLLMHKRLCGHDESLNLVRKIQEFSDFPPLSCNMSNKAKAMLSHCIMMSFEESASSFSGDLSMRLERALMYFTAGDEDQSEVVYAHPYSFIYGKYVEEAYLLQMKKAYDFDTLYGGDWLPYFRMLIASDANVIFSSRNYIKRVSSSPKLIKKLKESCNALGHSEWLS